MRFIALAAGLVALASAAAIDSSTSHNCGPQPAGKDFKLQVVDTSGSLDSGDFLQSYHTGAGLNALVTTSNQSAALTFSYNSTSSDVILSPHIQGYKYPYTLACYDATQYSAPKGYGTVSFNITDSGSPVTFDRNNYMRFPGHNHKTFAVCPKVIYVGGVYIDTLVWRDANVKTNETCSDVKVKAVPI
ncbi:Hypothetical protein R9X50_00100400 [Acrodontium crateriforme]|uniref:DUF7907 domain-containing protein n=1 Tax=Acrodontium crateriforme TaxID=150365 RepID=A0AAQ3LYY9_9PEZI|nr:Hypothetical protein R9X50_00100400 [Acrodontium crateriforme]